MKSFATIVSTIMVLFFTGCASVPMAPVERDIQAKRFSPAPDKASLYIYRHESFGRAAPMTVMVNGKALGQTLGKTYLQLDLKPGAYKVESHSENVSTLPLSTEAGKNYFVWQEVKMGMWMARNILQQVDESTGRDGVIKSKLIVMSISGDDLTPLDTDTTLKSPSISQAPSNNSITQKLRELQILRDDGVITEDDFQKKKQQFLDEL